MHGRLSDRWNVNKYLWLCLLFVAIYIPCLNTLRVSVGAAYALFGLAVANGAARTYSGWRKGGFNDPLQAWIFNVFDILLLTTAIRISGGLRSELWLLYFVLLISETLFASPAQSRVLLFLLIGSYLAATAPEARVPGYAITVGARSFFLYVIAKFARRLTYERERRAHEVALLREQVAASEERARIAREIHDGLGHALVTAILRLELCARLLRRDPPQAEQILQEEIPALRAAWNEGRDLAFHLRPWEPDVAGFAHSLRRHVSRFAERTGLAVEVEMDDEACAVEPQTEFALTRILQEALTNIAKHARASHVEIRLNREGRGLRCTVEDDGAGFVTDATLGSFGLNAMRERAEEIGGSFAITSRPNAGTKIEVALPNG